MIAQSIASRTGRHRTRAFSLIVTLIVIAMLAVVIVGFLASMSSERSTASAFANKSRADQAAQAGVESAMAILRQAFRDFPDSATVWETQSKSSDNTPNEGTSLYVRAVPNQGFPNQPDPTPASSPSANGTVDPTLNPNSPNNTSASGSDARSTFVLPLVSGASWQLLANRANAINGGGALSTDENIYPNLNVRRSAADTQGWIGTPPNYVPVNPPTAGTTPPPKPTRVPWVEIAQPDGYASPSTGPIVARYAFWVEDESFRANVNYAGLGDTSSGTATHVRRDNLINYHLNSADVDLVGPLNVLAAPNPTPTAQSIFDTRKLYPGIVFPEELAFGHAPALASNAALTDRLRFITTTQSGGLNLSRHGTQRLNLNELMYPKTANTYSVQNQIDNLVNTIYYHAPRFGQRFYRNATTTTPSNLDALSVVDEGLTKDQGNHSLIYLYKIAANIVDYMDQDSTPTFIASGAAIPGSTGSPPNPGQVLTGNFPSLLALSGVGVPNPLWAQGKEAGPYLEEGGMRFRGGPTADGINYQLTVDYYLEFWNMTTQDIPAASLGPNPCVRVANPPPWIGDYVDSNGNSQTHETFLPNGDQPPLGDASPSESRGYPPPIGVASRGPQRDYDIDLSGSITKSPITFKAGVTTVITTDPDYKDFIQDPLDQANVFVCPFLSPGKRVYNGMMPIANASSPAARCTRLRIPLQGYTTTSSAGGKNSDYETSVVLYTGKGYVDFMEGGLPMSGLFLFPAPNSKTSPPFVGGSLHGNTGSYPSMSGDPRTNNEQLQYLLYQSSGPVDQSRYFNFTYGNNGASGSDSSFGKPNINFMVPDGTSPYTPWPDYYHFTAPYGESDPNKAAATYAKIASLAPAVMANAPLTSIGQLGDVFDPARYTATNVNLARGGGRTFKLGQHDDRWDGDQTSASRTWASWRLADFFCAPPGVTTVGTSVPTGPFPDVMFQPGLINVNGVARDDGAALRAALTGFKFQVAPLPNSEQPPQYPMGDPFISGTPLNVDTSTIGIEPLITEIKARLTTTPTPTTLGPPGYTPLNTGTGPFFERGELSELAQFGRNAPAPTFPPTVPYPAKNLTGHDMSTVLDRGREELFRRLVEMTTTRGNVFTVYAMGQSIKQVGTVKNVTSTQLLKVTFRLMPKRSDGSDFHPATDTSGQPITLDLSSPSAQTIRFVKPDHYDIQILSSSKTGG